MGRENAGTREETLASCVVVGSGPYRDGESTSTTVVGRP